MEKYIEQCLNSFADGRFNDTLEVLIVNDGSTDGTVKIAEQYVQKYPDIFRIINKENGGHGSTINRGIKEAIGKYYKPVDGDDWLDTENLVSVIDRLKEIDVDLAVTDFFYYYSKTKQIKKDTRNFYNNNTAHGFDLSNCILLFQQIIYKTSILKENNLYFSEKVFYEDTEFCLYPVEFVKTITYIPIGLYYHRLDREGQSISIESKIKYINDIRQIAVNIFNFYKRKKNKNNKKTFYKKRILDFMDFYYYLTISDLWIHSENRNIRENQLFYKRLFFISPYLFLSFMIKDKLRLLMLFTWFSCDKQLLLIQKYVQVIKAKISKKR